MRLTAPIANVRHLSVDRRAMGCAVLALGTLGAALAYHVPGYDGNDDAYITYVYARNLARGLGFVFYPGAQQVLGTTTPLYALLLAAIAKLGLPIPQTSMALGALGAAACAALMAALGGRAGYPAAGIAAAVLGFAGPGWWRAVSGMETPLYAALILGAIYATASCRQRWAFALGALAAIVRIDGIAVLAAVVAVSLYQRNFRLRDVAPPVLLLAVWFCWLTWTFGSPIPTSGEAKILEQWISGRFAIPLPILVAATWSAARARRQPVVQGLIAWLAAYLVGLTLLGLPSFSWYYAPAGLAIVLLACVAAQDTLARLGRAFAWHGALPPVVPIVIAAAYAVVCVVRTPAPDPALRAATVNQQAGRWLHVHTSAHETVAAYETGLLAWESDRKVIDVLGLTEPAAQPYLERGDVAWALALRPAWVFLERPDFAFPIAQQFGRSSAFASYAPAVTWVKTAGDPYVLYRRR